jgi:hypothetical protein
LTHYNKSSKTKYRIKRLSRNGLIQLEVSTFGTTSSISGTRSPASWVSLLFQTHLNSNINGSSTATQYQKNLKNKPQLPWGPDWQPRFRMLPQTAGGRITEAISWRGEIKQ